MARKRKANYTISELREIFNLNTKDGIHHNKVFMQNEIFNNLIEALIDEEGNRINQFKTSTHIAYAYSYLYLAQYMYRYCKYYYMVGQIEKEIDEKMIKKIMGFSAKADAYTYLTKDKGGILKDLGYIRKESDKPYHYEINEWNDPEFEYESELELPVSVTGGSTRNRKINFPVKAFFRTPEDEKEGVLTGTYYEIDNTHQINFEVFMYCMADLELGVEGFYLYALCVYLNNKFRYGFDCTHENFARLSGMSIKEVKAQLKKLEERNMIKCDHKPFCLDKPVDKKTKANTYWICGIDGFAKDKSEYRQIPKQRKISAEQYEREIGFVGEVHQNDDSVFIDGESPFEKMAS